MLVIGWREWIALPELGVPAIKAKIDTGARSSALHAFDMKTFHEGGRRRVRFNVHPLQRRADVVIGCEADVIDERLVSDSGGHREQRLVIQTTVRLSCLEWPIEITLTNRDTMQFRMLLGRSAQRHQVFIDPGRSFMTGKALASVYGVRKKKRRQSQEHPNV